MTEHTQKAWNHLGGFINSDNPALADYLSQTHLSMSSAQAPFLLAKELGRQSMMIGILDGYFLVTWSFAAMLPLVLLLRYNKHPVKAASKT